MRLRRFRKTYPWEGIMADDTITTDAPDPVIPPLEDVTSEPDAPSEDAPLEPGDDESVANRAIVRREDGKLYTETTYHDGRPATREPYTPEDAA